MDLLKRKLGWRYFAGVLVDCSLPDNELLATLPSISGGADFTTISLEVNGNSTATETYRAIGGANTEVRWSDVGTGLLATASASWPAMIRPASTANVAYAYSYTSDTGGFGVYSGSAASANPAAYAVTQRRWGRWNWDAVGTFASAPIMTAYDTSAHAAPTVRASTGNPADNILSGSTTDTGATARSYLKANLYGQVTSTAAPAADPTNAPVVTDGTTGSVAPTAGTNWLTNFQGLMADVDYITFAATPAATVANQLQCEIALFTGPNMSPKVYVPVITLKYTWT